MKRMWNVAALGAVIVIGLGTFAVDATEPKAEWALDISSNPSVWKDAVVEFGYNTDDDVSQRYEVTSDESRVTSDLNYIAEGLRYRERLKGDARAVHRLMNGMTYTESIRMKDGYVGLGQYGNKELIIFNQLNGKEIKTYTFDAKDRQIYEILTGWWSGLFWHKGELNLIYRNGYDGDETTMLATFTQTMDDVTVNEIKMDNGFITHVSGTSYFDETSKSPSISETRYVPVAVNAYETIREGDETYYSGITMPGQFAYDTETGKVVQLAGNQDFWDYAVFENRLFTINTDGEETVIDLETGKQSTRKVLDSVNRAFYANGRLYQTRQVKDGVVIDVYEDGKQVSSAAVTPENEEAQAMLDQIDVYVRQK
ncbi:hypothetical protein [Exiguobacterium qingdaonense]|uniref:hypothetical protein n=1 Tax=Exiguobacterium qingdaonense TaxID=2751251 RepID=UPI001BE77E9A|nr:hypothetical protein [Exiguobacterium qingdaonense]